MRTANWLGLVLFAAAATACAGSDGGSFPKPPEVPDAAPDGAGGAAGASAAEAGSAAPDGAREAAAEAGGQAGAIPDGGAPEANVDAFDGGTAEAGVDVVTADRAPDSGDAGTLDSQPDRLEPDARGDVGGDAGRDAAPDTRDGGTVDAPIPPCGEFELEGVPASTYPYPLCGTTTPSPNGTYQFGGIRVRSPIASAFQERLVDGVMTVKNGATTTTYAGVPYTSPMGYEFTFHGAGGTDPIVFTTGVNEIRVTVHDALGRLGCLPQPCSWTVTQ